MTSAIGRVTMVAVACIALTGCFKAQSALADPTASARAEWANTLAVAAQESSAGRHAIADRVLTEYATRYPASGDAAEANFWRALYKLDPANTSATTRDAAVLLDSYLASPVINRRAEALTMRRLVASLESRPATAGPSSAAPRADAPKPDERTKDEEITRLKEELSKANAELERIRRRLAQPKP